MGELCLERSSESCVCCDWTFCGRLVVGGEGAEEMAKKPGSKVCEGGWS